MVDSLGVGFKYEDVLQLCQKAAQMDMARQGVAGLCRVAVHSIQQGLSLLGTSSITRSSRERPLLLVGIWWGMMAGA
jgi:hypothetical protein